MSDDQLMITFTGEQFEGYCRTFMASHNCAALSFPLYNGRYLYMGFPADVKKLVESDENPQQIPNPPSHEDPQAQEADTTQIEVQGQ